MITKGHNDYYSVGVMVLFIKFVDIGWFFVCNSYPCVLFESLSQLTRNHIFICDIWGNLPHSFFEILKSLCFTQEVSKFQKSELGKIIPNLPLINVITSTNDS